MTSELSAAERVLKTLGVTDPSEIDLEAIAWHLGARIKICELDGCEARILGYEDRAIIRVDRRRSPRRRRFSCAHELGHWHHHRGQMLFCRSDDIGNSRPGASALERVADAYAADLLLPRYLFQSLARQRAKLNFRMTKELADLFQASQTSVAIRLIEVRHSPAILVCHGTNGMAWFRRSDDVPDRWFPRRDLDPESFAFELLFGNVMEQAHPRVIGADAWFDRYDAGQYEIHEQSIKIDNAMILTYLLIEDDAMLED